MATFKIPDLGDKLDFVLRHCEFDHIRQILLKKDPKIKTPPIGRILELKQDGVIAAELDVHSSQWSRMKKGSEAISVVRLARLSEYFDIDIQVSVDPLIWTEPDEIFTRKLTAARYGRLRLRDVGVSLTKVLDERADADAGGLRVTVIARPVLSQRALACRRNRPPFRSSCVPEIGFASPSSQSRACTISSC